jgi:hypothetical protein
MHLAVGNRRTFETKTFFFSMFFWKQFQNVISIRKIQGNQLTFNVQRKNKIILKKTFIFGKMYLVNFTQESLLIALISLTSYKFQNLNLIPSNFLPPV